MPRRARLALLTLLLAAPSLFWAACGSGPTSPQDRFPLAEAMGFDPVVLDSVYDAAESSGWSRSLVLERHGEIVGEDYFQGYSATSLQTVWSVTKSFTSTLVGIALDRGLLDSLGAPLSDLIPPQVYVLDEQKGAITLRNLLTMSAGIPWVQGSEGSEYPEWVAAPSQVAYYLDKSMTSQPGEVFDYSDGAAHITSVVLEHATGQRPLDFAREMLLQPLGITASDWWLDNDGYCFGGVGFAIRPRDMVKLGRLFLQGGVWNGTRIVSQEWIDQATQIQIMAYPDNPGYQQYGYYWWVGTANSHPAYIAKGYGGQFIFVFPELDIVVATTTDWTGTREQANERYSFAYYLVRNGIVGAIVE